MEGHVPSTVQALHLIAHVFEQQLVFVQVHLQPASEQSKQELHFGCGDQTLGKHHETIGLFKAVAWFKSIMLHIFYLPKIY